MMKQLISIIFSLFFGIISAGFSPETLISVPTQNTWIASDFAKASTDRSLPCNDWPYVAIKDISIYDKVLCYDFAQHKATVQSVDCIRHKIADKAICITVQDECVIVAGDQRFYLPEHHAWICADALCMYDRLLTIDGCLIPIDGITITDGPIELYELTVHELHNFCVSRHRIVVHNTGLELVPVALYQLVPIAGFASVTPLAPVLYAGCAVAITGWALWSGIKQMQEKIRRNEVWLLEQQNNDSNDNTPSRDNQVEHCYPPVPEPEDPEKNKKKKEEQPRFEFAKSTQESNGTLRAVVGSAECVGTAQEVAKWIDSKKEEILNLVKDVLNNLAKYGKQIKRECIRPKDIAHVFSRDHLLRGLMQVDRNVKDLYVKIIGLIKEADAQELLTQGDTTIRTIVNNIPMEVRVRLEGDLLRNVDAYIGHSNRIVNNLVILSSR